MIEISVEKLRAIMPTLKAERAALFVEPIRETAERFELDSRLRLTAFLAQVAEESGELQRLVENLNYGANGLIATWPARFGYGRKGTVATKLAGKRLAESLARRPEAIAGFVYSGRFGNGDEASGDGWRFRGRGAIQITFRDTYRAAGKALGLDLEANPDQVAEPRVAMLTAGWYWDSRGINALADKGDFRGVTGKINPPLLHQDRREAYYRRGLKVYA